MSPNETPNCSVSSLPSQRFAFHPYTAEGVHVCGPMSGYTQGKHMHMRCVDLYVYMCACACIHESVALTKCKNLHKCLGLAIQKCWHVLICSMPAQAQTPQAPHWKCPWWHLGSPPHGLSAPLHSLAQARSLSDPRTNSESDLINTHQKKVQTNKAPIPTLSFPIPHFSLDFPQNILTR